MWPSSARVLIISSSILVFQNHWLSYYTFIYTPTSALCEALSKLFYVKLSPSHPFLLYHALTTSILVECIRCCVHAAFYCIREFSPRKQFLWSCFACARKFPFCEWSCFQANLHLAYCCLQQCYKMHVEKMLLQSGIFSAANLLTIFIYWNAKIIHTGFWGVWQFARVGLSTFLLCLQLKSVLKKG